MFAGGAERRLPFAVDKVGGEGFKARAARRFGARIFLGIKALRFHGKRPAGAETFCEIVDPHGKAVHLEGARRINVRRPVGKGTLQDAVFLNDDSFTKARDKVPWKQ